MEKSFASLATEGDTWLKEVEGTCVENCGCMNWSFYVGHLMSEYVEADN